jgi:hypothetical protein
MRKKATQHESSQEISTGYLFSITYVKIDWITDDLPCTLERGRHQIGLPRYAIQHSRQPRSASSFKPAKLGARTYEAASGLDSASNDSGQAINLSA